MESPREAPSCRSQLLGWWEEAQRDLQLRTPAKCALQINLIQADQASLMVFARAIILHSCSEEPPLNCKSTRVPDCPLRYAASGS